MRAPLIRTRLAAYAAMSPLALAVLVCYVGSVLWTFKVSLTNSRTLPTNQFVGLQQYARLFANERWRASLDHLALYSVLFVVSSLVIGALLAVALDRRVRLEGALRTVLLYPYAMSFIATGVVWQWLLAPDNGVGLLTDDDAVMYAIVIATVWQSAGLVMALLLAGLRSIDDDIWKAARIDGIPVWRTYLAIVLPMVRGHVATALLLLGIAVVKLYDAVVAMTQGGPGLASEVPAKFVMDHLFGRANIALASAGAMTLLVPVAALLLLYAGVHTHRGRA
jgi:glucose/mannose transport system permease protein